MVSAFSARRAASFSGSPCASSRMRAEFRFDAIPWKVSLILPCTISVTRRAGDGGSIPSPLAGPWRFAAVMKNWQWTVSGGANSRQIRSSSLNHSIVSGRLSAQTT